jgi:glycosyltransferase involved in cell wall biosynthesis
MRIAILGSVALPVPPPAQGGTEWVAYHQARGLVSLGHTVTLFAAHGSKRDGEKYTLIEVGGGDTVVGSSQNKASVDSVSIESSRNLRRENTYLAQVCQLLIDHKDSYDIILNNMRGEAVFLPIAKLLGKPFANVMHLPIFSELAALFSTYNTGVITISNVQRKLFPDLRYLATVGNCVDTSQYSFDAKGGDYLLMMGTIGRHKNQAAAIRVAKRLGMNLVMAGKIRDMEYHEEIRKDIDGKQIQWFGELDFATKLSLYQKAKAFIFPILWEEPFGLVMIESMSCGTPVVAFGNGAIPEVVVDGKTGFVIKDNNEDQMIEAIKNINSIRRGECRNHVLENFTIEKMVSGYEKALLSLGV